jgi:hypothetical protein
MKFIAVITLLMTVILTVFALLPIRLDDRILIEKTEEQASFLESIQYDGEPLTGLATNYLMEYNITHYETSFHPNDYIIPSGLPYVYSRDWRFSRTLDFDLQSEVIFQGHLFKDINSKYHILITYTFDYDQLGHLEHMMMLNAAHSFTYYLNEFDSSVSYRDQEYHLTSTYQFPEDRTFTVKPHEFHQPLKSLTYTGVLFLEIRDYPEGLLHLDFDFYQQKIETTTVILGFNKFKADPTIKYIPQSIELMVETEV